MKKIISLLVSLTLILSIVPMTVMAEDTTTNTGWDGTTTTEITNGTGTSSDPYLISTPEELAWARDLVNTSVTEGNTTTYPNKAKCFKLTADIDLNNKEWTPIGLVANNGFNGTFDGNGYAVKNIRMTVKRTYMGFFGHVESASKIKNLGIENMDVDIVGSGATIGGLFGRGYADEISNCYVKNSSILNNSTAETAGSEANLVNTGGTIGGFIGTLRTTTDPIKNCYVYNVEIGGPCRVSLGGFFGGAENDADKSVITNCYVAKLTEKTIEGRQTGRIYSFGKKKNAGTSTSVVNSWTEFIGRAGTRSDSSYPYEVEYAMGNEGATKRGIIAALVDNGDGNYVVDPEINDGYPCLEFERDFAPATEFAGGSGTDTDPYIIATAAQLALVAQKVNGGGVWTSAHYKLDRDIDFGNMEWTPIGNATYTFGGNFDGNGHVIRNLYISTLTKHVGLFGSVLGGTIENLGIENMTVALKTQSADWQSVTAGGMVGYLYGTVKNCYVKNSSIKMIHMGSGYGNVGSFVGSLRRPATIENCYTYNVGIHGDRRSNQGGFLGTGGGNSVASSITNCYTNAHLDCEGVYQTGYLEAPFYAFAKDAETYTTFTNCYSTLTDAAGGTDENAGYNYNEANSAGTLGATKKTITDNLVTADGKFKVDSAINNGFPALWFEKVQEEENYVMAAIIPGDKIKVTLVEKKAVANAQMYVATYASDGRMIDAEKIAVASPFTFTTNVSSKDVDHVKVFVWDNNLNAISKMYKGIVDFGTMIHVLPLEDGVTEEDIPSYGRKTRLVMMGDSLMDSVLNSAPDAVQKRKWGWEAYIGDYLNDDITVVKHGHSGHTIQKFINGASSYHTCSWADIKDQFSEGDYVVIGLGTNDNSRINNYINGVTTDANGNPVESYSAEQFKTWYKQIIADVKAKGANIILLTPPPANGNVRDGKFYAPTTHSRTALLELADEADVEVIDITQLYVDALNALIDNKTYTVEEMCITKNSSGTITASGTIFVDNVHFTEEGADLLAETVANAIKDLSATGLEDFIVLPE